MKKTIEFSKVDIKALLAETPSATRDSDGAAFHRYTAVVDGKSSRQCTVSIKLAGNKRKEIALTTLKALIDQLSYSDIECLVENIEKLQALPEVTVPVGELVLSLSKVEEPAPNQ